MTIAPNRAVALLTPLVFAPLAGAISVLVAQHMPGVEIDRGALEAIFIAGATIAFAKAGLWLKGWQEYEKHTEGVEDHDEPDLDDGLDLLDLSDEDDLFDAELDLEDPAAPVAIGSAR